MELALLPKVYLRPGEAVTSLLPFTVRRRVHWGDGDAAMIAYTSRFVDFAMEALDAWWEANLDTNWYAIRQQGGGSPMVSMAFDFSHPVQPGERLNCTVTIENLGSSSLTAKVTGVNDDGAEIFQGRLTSVYIDFARQKSQPFPDAARRRIQRYQEDCIQAVPGLAAPEVILNYWFGNPGSPDREQHRPLWFGTAPIDKAAVDREMRSLFRAGVDAAQQGRLNHWQNDPRATLALLLLLDQFSRNVYRGDAQAFAGDALARDIANAAVARGDCDTLPIRQAMFYYLPFEHSEDLADQDRSVALFSQFKSRGEDPEVMDRLVDYAVRHQKIIARFGRFPHRNDILGRQSTDEERAFLQEPNSSF